MKNNYYPEGIMCNKFMSFIFEKMSEFSKKKARVDYGECAKFFSR